MPYGYGAYGYGGLSPQGNAQGAALLQRARALANQSALFGARRLGLTDPRQATPIAVARPGESPYRQRAYASIAAAGSGVPQQLFLEEALRLTPLGVPEYSQLRRRY